jgi:hypothetical protein
MTRTGPQLLAVAGTLQVTDPQRRFVAELSGTSLVTVTQLDEILGGMVRLLVEAPPPPSPTTARAR